MSLLPSCATESETDLYTTGECHVLAVALHRRLGWSIEVRVDNEEPFWTDESDPDNFIPAVLHVYALDENLNAWDVRGMRPYDAITAEMEEIHSPLSQGSDECRSEAALRMYVGCWGNAGDEGEDGEEIERPLGEYTDQEVDEAWQVARRIFTGLPGFNPDAVRHAVKRKVAP